MQPTLAGPSSQMSSVDTEQKVSCVKNTSPFRESECDTEMEGDKSEKENLTHILFSLLICLRVGIGIGYPMFSHGGLSRALEMKTPPPLGLAPTDGRRMETHPGLGGARSNLTNAVRDSAKVVIHTSDI